MLVAWDTATLHVKKTTDQGLSCLPLHLLTFHICIFMACFSSSCIYRCYVFKTVSLSPPVCCSGDCSSGQEPDRRRSGRVAGGNGQRLHLHHTGRWAADGQTRTKRIQSNLLHTKHLLIWGLWCSFWIWCVIWWNWLGYVWPEEVVS